MYVYRLFVHFTTSWQRLSKRVAPKGHINRNDKLTAPPLPFYLGPLAGRSEAAHARIPGARAAAAGEHLGGGARLQRVDVHGGVAVAEGHIEEADSGETGEYELWADISSKYLMLST